MHIFLFMAGLVWIAWGALILGAAVGGIHEVYAAILLSSGVLFLGLAELLRRLKELVSDQRKGTAPTSAKTAAAEEYWQPNQAAQNLINGGR